MTKDEALKLALEALERSVATCFDQYSHEQVMSRPEHFINLAITAIKQALAAQPVQLLATGFCTHEWIDDTKDKPQWRCIKCGKNYRREQA
jgi:hypothetical protein